MASDPQWLKWAQRLQALAQTGLAFAENRYDRERYEAVREIAAEMMAVGSGMDVEPILSLFAQQAGYTTPKMDVRGAAFRDGKLLMVRERVDNRWTLPGGWADVGDSPAESVVREMFEESGFRARAIKLLAIYDRSKHPHTPLAFYAYKLFFVCEITGGEPTPSIETSEVGFFGEHEIPELSIGRVTPWQIGRVFEHYRHPELPTEFD